MAEPKATPEVWAELFKRSPGLVLGFHGCDRDVAEAVLSGKVPHLKPSTNEYDWLGAGIYFWESDPWRALAFANECMGKQHLTKGQIKDPYVVGAVLNLGICCNLLEVDALAELRRAYELFEEVYKLVGVAMPENKGTERGARFLDKAIVEFMHSLRAPSTGRPPLAKYHSVRAAFLEGEDLYKGAGFKERNHIQIAIRDSACILGYFRVPGLG